MTHMKLKYCVSRSSLKLSNLSSTYRFLWKRQKIRDYKTHLISPTSQRINTSKTNGNTTMLTSCQIYSQSVNLKHQRLKRQIALRLMTTALPRLMTQMKLRIARYSSRVRGKKSCQTKTFGAIVHQCRQMRTTLRNRTEITSLSFWVCQQSHLNRSIRPTTRRT